MMKKIFLFLNIFNRKKLKIGDRVKIFGGYSTAPEWLGGQDAYYGQVVKFIPGPYKKDDAVVCLDKDISFMQAKGKFLVLTLRYEGAIWRKVEIVHLHLFETIPQGDRWCINKDEWEKNHIESHASYRIENKKDNEAKALLSD